MPDDKDWTWVLERPCPECGFDASSVPPESIGALVRANAAAWVQVLARPADELRRRPADDRWAPLEYACHVRDVYLLYRIRLLLMLREDDPLFANWDQDATAVEERYLEQDPAAVSASCVGAADGIGRRLRRRAGRAVAAARPAQRRRAASTSRASAAT